VFTEPQGRSGDSFAPENLTDLISSIAAVGLLEPVLAEEITRPGGVSYRLVAGERRLRAMLWGAAHMPENPHFAVLTALVCPGPLTESERRRWQTAENFAREPLRPGELGAALLWHGARCSPSGCRRPAARSRRCRRPMIQPGVTGSWTRSPARTRRSRHRGRKCWPSWAWRSRRAAPAR
jgi:hypothetical protein